jgi:hypothetical protein
MRTSIGAVSPSLPWSTGPALTAETRTAPKGVAADEIALRQALTIEGGVPGFVLSEVKGLSVPRQELP